MSDFFRREFHIRPILLVDPPEESVIIRRGSDAARLCEGLVLQDNQVLGKREGELLGLPYFWAHKEVQIDPGVTKIIAQVPKVRSRLWKIDVDSPVDTAVFSMTFLTLARLMPSEVQFTKYARVGDKIKHKLQMEFDADDIIVHMTNNHADTILVNALVIG